MATGYSPNIVGPEVVSAAGKTHVVYSLPVPPLHDMRTAVARVQNVVEQSQYGFEIEVRPLPDGIAPKEACSTVHLYMLVPPDLTVERIKSIGYGLANKAGMLFVSA